MYLCLLQMVKSYQESIPKEIKNQILGIIVLQPQEDWDTPKFPTSVKLNQSPRTQLRVGYIVDSLIAGSGFNDGPETRQNYFSRKKLKFFYLNLFKVNFCFVERESFQHEF